MKQLLAGLLMLATLSVAYRAEAAETEADKLFREGRAAVEANDLPLACTKFRESHALDPAPGTLLNLGDCEDRQGLVIEATEHFRLAAAAFARNDKRREIATQRAAESGAKIANLTVHRGASLAEQAQVTLEGSVLGPGDFDQARKVNPGTLTLEVSQEGHEPVRIPVTVERGAAVEVVAEAGPVKTSPTAVAARSEQHASSSPLRTVGFAAAGVGIASLAVGAITGFMAMGEASTYRENCNDRNECNPQGMDASSSLKTLTPISTITVIAGGVLVAGGITLVLVAPKSTRGPEGTSVRLSPQLGPQVAGGTLSVRF